MEGVGVKHGYGASTVVAKQHLRRRGQKPRTTIVHPFVEKNMKRVGRKKNARGNVASSIAVYRVFESFEDGAA